MDKRREVILITGPAACGKTTTAHRLAKSRNATVVHCDSHRYKPGTWDKVSADFYQESVMLAVQRAPGSVIVEGVYLDVSDSENCRPATFNQLLEWATSRIVFKPPLDKTVENIVRRTMNRVRGTEEAGAAEETPESVTRLILKQVNNYAKIIGALERFEVTCSERGVHAEIN